MNDDFNKLSYLGFPHYSAVLGFGHTSKLNTLPPAVHFVKLITLRQSMISVAHININALLYNFRLYDKHKDSIVITIVSLISRFAPK